MKLFAGIIQGVEGFSVLVGLYEQIPASDRRSIQIRVFCDGAWRMASCKICFLKAESCEVMAFQPASHFELVERV